MHQHANALKHWATCFFLWLLFSPSSRISGTNCIITAELLCLWRRGSAKRLRTLQAADWLVLQRFGQLVMGAANMVFSSLLCVDGFVCHYNITLSSGLQFKGPFMDTMETEAKDFIVTCQSDSPKMPAGGGGVNDGAGSKRKMKGRL